MTASASSSQGPHAAKASKSERGKTIVYMQARPKQMLVVSEHEC